MEIPTLGSAPRRLHIAQGDTVTAGVVELQNGETAERANLEKQTLTIRQKVDRNAPQMRAAISAGVQAVAQYCKEYSFNQSPTDPVYLALCLHHANRAIHNQRPTQDDAKRREQLDDALTAGDYLTGGAQTDSGPSIGQTETEQLGAIVCVNKAVCLYMIMETLGFTDLYLQEIPPATQGDDGHTNVLIRTPEGYYKDFDAGVVTPLHEETPGVAGVAPAAVAA